MYIIIIKRRTKYMLMEQMVIIMSIFFWKEAKPHDGVHLYCRRVIRSVICSLGFFLFVKLDARCRYSCTYTRIYLVGWRKVNPKLMTAVTATIIIIIIIIIVLISSVMKESIERCFIRGKRERSVVN